MKVVELLEGAKKEIAEVEAILDETSKQWLGAHVDKHALENDLDYLLIQIANVVQSARDFKRHKDSLYP